MHALFDVHCHLQDARLAHCVPKLLLSAREAGVQWFAVNGTSEEDWKAVQELGAKHPQIIPCFGLHPWWLAKRSTDWLSTLRYMLETVPTAAVGEAGLDRSPRGSASDDETQAEVLREQLELARELHRPAAVHCVRAFGSLHDVLGGMGSFPAGLILHSYGGPAEMVRPFSQLNAYFSFSGLITSMKPEKARKILQMVPLDRLLLESDAPDALPKPGSTPLSWVPDDPVTTPQLGDLSNRRQPLNHPANIRVVLSTVASFLGKSEQEVSAAAYQNSVNLFSFPGSKSQS